MAYSYGRKVAGVVFAEKKFETALNSINAILDLIADELGAHQKDSAEREKVALEAARNDLQKAAGLVLKAQKRF